MDALEPTFCGAVRDWGRSRGADGGLRRWRRQQHEQRGHPGASGVNDRWRDGGRRRHGQPGRHRIQFNPSDPTVKSGEVTFNLKNDGRYPHSLEIEDVNGQDKEIEGDVSSGQSGTLKVNLPPGKYEFYCPVDNHRQMGMTGEITVK